MATIPGAFTKTDISFDNVAEMVLSLQSYAGFATVSYGPLPQAGATPTGLANDGTVYTATVKIDGTNRAVSVVGSAAQTFTTLVAEILADLTTWATVTLVGGDIIITSKTTGATSLVVITNTGTLTRNFSTQPWIN